MSRTNRLLCDISAVLVTTFWVLPILWWALSSITPTDALLDLGKMLRFDLTQTFDHFALAIRGETGTIFGSRQSLIDSIVVAVLSMLFTLLAALPAAFVLSRQRFKGRTVLLNLSPLQRFLPAIALIFPLVVLYHMAGLVAALTTTALAPVFVFVLLMQKHLVRRLTMGLYK